MEKKATRIFDGVHEEEPKEGCMESHEWPPVVLDARSRAEDVTHLRDCIMTDLFRCAVTIVS